MTDPFDQFDEPGPLDAIKWENYDGQLVLITPLRVDRNVPTVDGDGVRDVILADVAILDGPHAPIEHHGTPIFPAYLQGQIRRNVGTGRSNLGRVGKDATRQKRGQSAPWVLATPTEGDKQIARAHLMGKTSGAPTTPPSTTISTEPPF